MQSGMNSTVYQPLYDTVQLAAAVGQTVTFFNVPVGGALTGAINKTKLHTNLVQPGQIENGWTFQIEGFTFAIKNTVAAGTLVTKADYELIYRSGLVEFKISDTVLYTLPLIQIPSGIGEMQYFSNITPAATEYRMNHGVSSINNMYRVNEASVTLKSNQSFAVTLNVADTVVAVTDCVFTLWGWLTRPALN